jgi:hypothetical protein
MRKFKILGFSYSLNGEAKASLLAIGLKRR